MLDVDSGILKATYSDSFEHCDPGSCIDTNVFPHETKSGQKKVQYRLTENFHLPSLFVSRHWWTDLPILSTTKIERFVSKLFLWVPTVGQAGASSTHKYV